MIDLSGNVVDLLGDRIFEGRVRVEDGRIAQIEPLGDENPDLDYLCPGLVDAHVHVESSLLVPSEFARLAAPHGTVATVSDPHEIANVLGVDGVEYMIENGDRVPLKFFFGAPSCVPATPFETAGAELGVEAVTELLERSHVRYLSEMMNVPGAANRDEEVMAKIAAAEERGKPVDGHAPGVRGETLQAYVAAGISTDHESFTEAEGREKLELGLKLAIREGSAARNFDELAGLIEEYPEQCMLCTDDMHPDRLAEGHIDALVRRGLDRGIAPLTMLRCASLRPVEHYDLPVGLLQKGDPADLLVVDGIADPDAFRVKRTYVNGNCVAENGEPRISSVDAKRVNRFDADPVTARAFRVELPEGLAGDDDASPRVRIIRARGGALVTEEDLEDAPLGSAPSNPEGKIEDSPSERVSDGAEEGMRPELVPSSERDLAKLAVVNRYEPAPPAIALVRGFGLEQGALASSVAHDSHNVVAAGMSDGALAEAVNGVIAHRGGLALATDSGEKPDGSSADVLPLPVAGLMTDRSGPEVARRYEELDRRAKEELGSTLEAPFMTLSFMALLVIPELKLSDRGLFDARRFAFTSLFLE